MKLIRTIFHFIITLSIMNSIDAAIPYCHTHTFVTYAENKLLQQLIPRFAEDEGCRVANNCILKWDIQPDYAKFSIAWQKQCGDGGIGDNGLGSTFICGYTATHGTCCMPLGYSQYRICE